jgi:hypothetical protein
MLKLISWFWSFIEKYWFSYEGKALTANTKPFCDAAIAKSSSTD